MVELNLETCENFEYTKVALQPEAPLLMHESFRPTVVGNLVYVFGEYGSAALIDLGSHQCSRIPGFDSYDQVLASIRRDDKLILLLRGSAKRNPRLLLFDLVLWEFEEVIQEKVDFQWPKLNKTESSHSWAQHIAVNNEIIVYESRLGSYHEVHSNLLAVNSETFTVQKIRDKGRRPEHRDFMLTCASHDAVYVLGGRFGSRSPLYVLTLSGSGYVWSALPSIIIPTSGILNGLTRVGMRLFFIVSSTGRDSIYKFDTRSKGWNVVTHVKSTLFHEGSFYEPLHIQGRGILFVQSSYEVLWMKPSN